MTLPDIVGLVGSAVVIVAYLGNLRGTMPSENWQYALLNLIGAALILFSLRWAWNLAAALVEVFWAGISIYGLVRSLRLRRLR